MTESNSETGPRIQGDLGAWVQRINSIIQIRQVEPKKTSLIMTPQGQSDGRKLSDLQQVSFTEAVHRSLRLNVELWRIVESGGEVIIRHPNMPHERQLFVSD